MTAILDPLAARYAHWLGLPAAAVHDTDDETPGQVRAMQMVLRVERAAPPPRTALLEAAAVAAITLCLDPRAAPGGPWHDDVTAWITGRIRKVSRRARGAHWDAVRLRPGVTVTEPPEAGRPEPLVGAVAEPRPGSVARPLAGSLAGSLVEPASESLAESPAESVPSVVLPAGAAQVRALVPGLVAALPREVARLQVAGTELPADEPGPPEPDRPALWLNPAVPMTVGKAAAQVGHATMLAAALLHAAGEHAALADWAASGYRVSVRTATQREWGARHPGDDPLNAWRRRRVVAVRDAGFTEVPPGTVTVLAQLP